MFSGITDENVHITLNETSPNEYEFMVIDKSGEHEAPMIMHTMFATHPTEGCPLAIHGCINECEGIGSTPDEAFSNWAKKHQQ